MTNENAKTEKKIKKNGGKDTEAELTRLRKENEQLQEKVTRALADYQNLTRRQKQEQEQIVNYARMTVFDNLLQPLEHLSLAAKSLADKGLDMVVESLWQALAQQGLQENSPLGQKFDPKQMEVIEKVGEGEIVKEVASPGYTVNGQVIKFAKVKVG